MCEDKALEVLRLEIGKLELKPGDILVARLPIDTSDLISARIWDNLKALLPEDIKCLVMRGNVELGIIHQESSLNGR